MNRSTFLATLLSPVLLLFRRKEEKPPEYALKYARLIWENSKKERVILEEAKKGERDVMIIRGRNGRTYYYYKGIEDAANRWELDYLTGLLKP